MAISFNEKRRYITKIGTHIKLIGTGPESIQFSMSLPEKQTLIFRSTFRQMQADIIEIHLARATGGGCITPCAEANRNLVDIGQVDAFVGEELQIDIPLRPFFNQCHTMMNISDNCTAIESNIQPLVIIVRLAPEPNR